MSVLGHQTPHMSMVYARISDAEVLRDYRSGALGAISLETPATREEMMRAETSEPAPTDDPDDPDEP